MPLVKCIDCGFDYVINEPNALCSECENPLDYNGEDKDEHLCFNCRVG